MAFCFNKDRAKFDEFLQFVEEKKIGRASCRERVSVLV